MAKTNKADMSCARVKKYTASDVSKAERHNERKNETYENMNVIEERIPYNVHFKKPTAPTYMEQLKQMETDGQVSLRGLRKDATLFNEIVIDVNTMYFERNGGYEYAKQFYEEAYHFIEEKFGADNVISAVMHADEINVAASEELGKEVYHYHLHAMVLPVVEKEILWSKRCKDEKLRGTVKEVVHQISHSKKWKSDIPLTDEKGNPLLRKNGKPMAQTLNYLSENNLMNIEDLTAKTDAATARVHELQVTIRETEKRMAELHALKGHIINYVKTREVYVAYRMAGYSKKFVAEHEQEIRLHQAAKEAFSALGTQKIPKVKAIQAEYDALREKKKQAYAAYHQAQDEMRQLLTVRANVERILGIEEKEKGQQIEKKKER